VSRTASRVAALGGLVYVVLSLLGNDALGGSKGIPTQTDSPSAFGRYFGLHPVTTGRYVAFEIEVLGLVCFIGFAAALWRSLARADEDGVLAGTAFGAALAAIIVKLVSGLPVFAAVYRSKTIDSSTATALIDIGNWAFALTWVLNGVMLAAVAAIALRSDVLPRWLAWGAAILPVPLLATAAVSTKAPPIPFLLALVWIAATSVVLARRTRELAPRAIPVPA